MTNKSETTYYRCDINTLIYHSFDLQEMINETALYLYAFYVLYALYAFYPLFKFKCL